MDQHGINPSARECEIDFADIGVYMLELRTPGSAVTSALSKMAALEVSRNPSGPMIAQPA